MAFGQHCLIGSIITKRVFDKFWLVIISFMVSKNIKIVCSELVINKKGFLFGFVCNLECFI